MKKLAVFLLIIILLVTGCKKEDKFYLEEKYYGESNMVELDKKALTKLVNNKENFAIFIYQPLCAASNSFSGILNNFINNNQINIYKMSFSNMKETFLNKKIKYYPSFVVFKDGKLIDFLDANEDKDSKYYKTESDFKKWFTKYVKIKNTKNDKIDTTNKEENNEMDENIVLKNVTYDKNKINIYFFWGDGCPHCEAETEFFKEIEKEYGKYFKLNKYEVWYNEKNARILTNFASKMNDEVTGVPYTIIGNKTFSGFTEEYGNEMIEVIKRQYKNSFDVYFDK